MTDYADKIEFFLDYLLINTESQLSVLNKATWTIELIDYPDNTMIPDQLYVDVDQKLIYVIYADYNGKARVIKLNEDLEIIDSYNLNFDYMTSIIKNKKLYILHQIENVEETGGKLAVFDLHSGEKIQEFDIPKEKVKVQDFIIID